MDLDPICIHSELLRTSVLSMNPRSLCSVVVIALLVVAWPAAAPRYMSVDEVRAGMVGVGRTVFEGDRVDEFNVHILGVLRNINGPQRNMVLARLEGCLLYTSPSPRD